MAILQKVEGWCWKEKQVRGQRSFQVLLRIWSLIYTLLAGGIECISEYECLPVDFAPQWIGKILCKEACIWIKCNRYNIIFLFLVFVAVEQSRF